MRTTPRMSHHARVRCRELGISTKRAKRIVQERVSTYPARDHCNNGITCQSTDQEFAVVWDPDANNILTVVPRIQEDYVRTPTGFDIVRRTT